MASGEVNAGQGAGEVAVGIAPAPSAVLDPIGLARVAFVDRLEKSISHLPEAAVVAWAEWPDAPGTRTLVPSPVRVGTISNEHVPVVLPTDGSQQYAIGLDELNVPIKARNVVADAKQNLSQATLTHLKEKEVAAVREREQQRLGYLEKERKGAIALVQGMALRTLASTRPGSVQLDVCGSPTTLRSMSGFGPLSKSGLYRPVSIKSMSQLLADIDHDMAARQGSVLSDELPTLRALVEARGRPAPVPFRIVALFGEGTALPTADQALLQSLLQQAEETGYTFFMHGIRLPSHRPRLTLAYDNSRVARVMTHGLLSVNPAYDYGPPPTVVRDTSEKIAAEARGESIVPPDAKGAAHSNGFVVALGEGLPEYQAGMEAGFRGIADATRVVEDYKSGYPWLQPGELSAIQNTELSHLNLARAAAFRPDTVVAQLKQALKEKDAHPATLLSIWAAIALAESTLGHGQTRRTAAFRPGMEELTRGHLYLMASVVDVTRRHPGNLHPTMLPTIERGLPNDPPPWAFQLLADRAVSSQWSSYMSQLPQTVIDALCYDLGQTYGCELMNEGRVQSPRAASCLAACRLLDLHGFTTTLAPDYNPARHTPWAIAEQPDPLIIARNQAMRLRLARYVERSLLQLNRKQVERFAPAALPTYDACYALLNEQGFTPTVRDLAVGAGEFALRSAVGAGRTLRGLLSRRGGEEAAQGEGPAGTEPDHPDGKQ